MFRFLSGLFWSAVIVMLAAVVATKSFPLPGTVPILMYHSIGDAGDAKERKEFVSRESFSAQMRFLKFFGFRIIPMETYEQIRKGVQTPKGREIVITFDDGNETFIQEAWPVLKKYSFPVTLFLVSESAKRQTNGSMTPEDFKDLLRSGLVTFGSNTKTHPALPEIQDAEQLMEEVKGSKEDLETEFQTPVNYFSYPNGDFEDASLQAAKKAGYHLAFTTSHHKLGRLEETDYSITRMNITQSSDNPIVFWAKVIGLYQTHKTYWQKLKNWVH